MENYVEYTTHGIISPSLLSIMAPLRHPSRMETTVQPNQQRRSCLANKILNTHSNVNVRGFTKYKIAKERRSKITLTRALHAPSMYLRNE